MAIQTVITWGRDGGASGLYATVIISRSSGVGQKELYGEENFRREVGGCEYEVEE